MSTFWLDDAVEFPRLISEINAMEPVLSDAQIDMIVAATRLKPSQIDQIVTDAERSWEDIVRMTSGLDRKRWFVPGTVKKDVRFARLLYGVYQAGLAPSQWASLSTSMDLHREHLKELFLRAADAHMRELET